MLCVCDCNRYGTASGNEMKILNTPRIVVYGSLVAMNSKIILGIDSHSKIKTIQVELIGYYPFYNVTVECENEIHVNVSCVNSAQPNNIVVTFGSRCVYEFNNSDSTCNIRSVDSIPDKDETIINNISNLIDASVELEKDCDETDINTVFDLGYFVKLIKRMKI